MQSSSLPGMAPLPVYRLLSASNDSAADPNGFVGLMSSVREGA